MEGKQPVFPIHHSAPSHLTCLPVLTLHKAAKTTNKYTFTLKIIAVMSAETLDNFQYLTRFIPEGRSCSLVKDVFASINVYG